MPTEADKSIDSPYNTYLYPGLPPRPHRQPGLESIKAAMEPESTSYYYYTWATTTSTISSTLTER